MKTVALVVLIALVGSVSSFSVPSKSTTVSGLSAGGFMASQYHVAFSSDVSGAAVFAGGPYYCSGGQMTNALTRCMSVPLMLNVYSLISDAKSFATDGKIDELSNLDGTNVYLYSGTKDSVVSPDVVKKAGDWYKLVSDKINISSDFATPSEHCIPTVDFGNECSNLGSPFINKCNYDGPGRALAAIIPTLKPAGTQDDSNIVKIDMSKFFPGGKQPTGMSTTAFVYTPTACQTQDNSTSCSIHVSFHGCEQTFNDIGSDYYSKAGFNKYAESNNFIILYPQSESSLLSNPKSCFDWWGYTDGDFAFKTGQQMATVAAAVAWLKSSPAEIMPKASVNSKVIQK